MASALRGIHRLVSVARPAGIRPTLPFVAKGRCIASISQRHRSIPPCQAESSRLRPQWTLVLKRAEVPPSRNYADDSAMTLDTLQDRVIDVLKMFDKIDPDKVTPEAHFVNDLGLDSLDVVEIVMAFEDEFGVEIDDEQAEKIFTAVDAVNFLKMKLDVH